MKTSNALKTGFAGDGLNMSSMFKRWSHIFMKSTKAAPQYEVMPDFVEMIRHKKLGLGEVVTRQNMSDSIYGHTDSEMTSCWIRFRRHE